MRTLHTVFNHIMLSWCLEMQTKVVAAKTLPTCTQGQELQVYMYIVSVNVPPLPSSTPPLTSPPLIFPSPHLPLPSSTPPLTSPPLTSPPLIFLSPVPPSAETISGRGLCDPGAASCPEFHRCERSQARCHEGQEDQICQGHSPEGATASCRYQQFL